MLKLFKKLTKILPIFILTSVIVFQASVPAQALSGSSFKAGNIISDSLFFRQSSLSASTIKNFLNSKIPDCATDDTCLNNRKFDTRSKSASSGLCTALSAKKDQSAARIIYDVSRACKVDSKVLIVMLQKEQGLVTHTNPSRSRFLIAMGYACPDTAPCDTQYYGFFNQVYNAARQLRRYVKDAHLFQYRAKRYNYIQYNPSVSCGKKRVYINNSATAALYNYTPYTPNAATLAVGLGVEAPCGAYGNKNFWWYYNMWFGSTLKETSARFVSCSGQKYLVENSDNRKRPLTNAAVNAMELTNDDFETDGFGCNFSSFDLSMTRLVRSRSSEKLYLVDKKKAYHVKDQSAADAWGLGSINQTVPYVNPGTIHENLVVRRFLPRVGDSDNSEVLTHYLVDDDRRIPITGTTSGNHNSLDLIVGYDEVPNETFSVALLQTLTNQEAIEYSFKVGSDWYLLDHNETRKISPAVADRWDEFLDGPTLDNSILGMFKSNSGIHSFYKRDNFYYHLKSDSSIRYTNYDYIAKEWGIDRGPQITRLLRNKLERDLSEEYAKGITGNVRLVECSGNKYIVERFIPTKRPITNGGLLSWGFDDKYAQQNDRACGYSTYSVSAARLLRSRKTKKAYYVINNKAYHIYNQTVANNWSLGSITNLPQFESKSITDNFEMKGTLPTSP